MDKLIRIIKDVYGMAALVLRDLKNPVMRKDVLIFLVISVIILILTLLALTGVSAAVYATWMILKPGAI